MDQQLQTLEEKKTLRNKILSMILPITMENVFQMTVGLVSMAMIGRIDTFAIGAVGLGLRITKIVWALLKGVTTGATVFVAQSYGAKNYKKMKTVIHQTLISGFALIIIVQQLIYWNAHRILNWFGAQQQFLEYGVIFIRYASWGLPFVAIMLVVAGVLQGMGNAKTPMLIALVMNILNVLISWFLIFGKLGLPELGVRGAGIATAVSQFIAACIGIYVLFNKNGMLRSVLNKSFFKLDLKEIFSIFRVGLPTAFESIFLQISALILTKLILSFGETAMAAHQLGLQSESISYMPAMGFGIAATAFIGQSLGAKDPALAKSYLKEVTKGSILLTSVSAFILWFFPGAVMRLLTDQEPVIEMGIIYLRLMAVVQIPQNLSGVLNGALRGAGFTRVPMIVAGSGVWFVRLPLSFLLANTFGFGIIGVWVAMTLDLAFRFCFSYFLYKRKNIYKSDTLLEQPA